MNFKEYGNPNNKTIMLLHGGGLSWWNYRSEAEKLKDKYHVILPILDGHSGSDRSFTSIEKNSDEIIDYINSNLGGHIHLIGGLSLGGQILLEILSKKNDICDFAIIESASVIPSKITSKFIKPAFSISYGLIKKKWFSKLQFKSLKIRKDLFEDYYNDTCNILKKDLIAFTLASLNYEIKDSLENIKAKTIVIVGEKERKIVKKSAIKINQKNKNSEIEILKNYYHGDLSLNNPDEYIKIIEKKLH